MLTFLQLATALFALKLLYDEVIGNRFANYATSIFLVCFVPLFCVYPVLADMLVGGAYSVVPNSETIIYDDNVYLIYQIFCLTTLGVITISKPQLAVIDRHPDWRRKFEATDWELAGFAAVTSFGVFLYIYATGLSVAEVFSASRFEWFTSSDYSPFLFVTSTYLVALAPVGLVLALQQRATWRWAAVILAILVFSGLLAKDRKWLIYIVSAMFAFAYIRNDFAIRFSKTAVIVASLTALALVFWQVARGVLFNYYLTGTGDVLYESQEVARRLLTQGDFPYYYNASITAIDMVYNFDYSIPFALLRRQLLFFLPAGFSLGLKVEDISALFADAIGAGDAIRRGNMPPGYYGLFVISFGWVAGVIICSLVPLALRALDRFIQRSRGIGSIVVLAHLMSSVILLLRGDDSSATYFMVSSMLLFFLIRPASLVGTRAALAPQISRR